MYSEYRLLGMFFFFFVVFFDSENLYDNWFTVLKDTLYVIHIGIIAYLMSSGFIVRANWLPG